jgi:chromosomal replication initiator protein
MRLSAVEQLKQHGRGKDLAVAIVETICEEYSFEIQAILGKSRTQPLTLARQMCMVLIHELTGWSLPLVADHFKRDHTTVLHAITRVLELRKEDPEFEVEYQRIKDIVS